MLRHAHASFSPDFPAGTMPMPSDKGAWGHTATPSPRLHHSQSFCAAEALTQFWRDDVQSAQAPPPGIGPSALNRPMLGHSWSTPKEGMYMLQPPPPPPLGMPSQGMFSPPAMAEGLEGESSMLSHATPLKPMHEPQRARPPGGNTYV